MSPHPHPPLRVWISHINSALMWLRPHLHCNFERNAHYVMNSDRRAVLKKLRLFSRRERVETYQGGKGLRDRGESNTPHVYCKGLPTCRNLIGELDTFNLLLKLSHSRPHPTRSNSSWLQLTPANVGSELGKSFLYLGTRSNTNWAL